MPEIICRNEVRMREDGDVELKLQRADYTVAGWVIISAADLERVRGFRWSYVRPGYAVAKMRVGGKRTNVSMHRWLMNPPPELVVDHINGNGLDNRRGNMRSVTTRENLLNNKTARALVRRFTPGTPENDAMREAVRRRRLGAHEKFIVRRFAEVI